jgi:hypothetical protein
MNVPTVSFSSAFELVAAVSSAICAGLGGKMRSGVSGSSSRVNSNGSMTSCSDAFAASSNTFDMGGLLPSLGRYAAG